ncbi:hypothetical protein N7486_006683 [Penicillium sp. IBT 16267x]|nr:hypothetical protein N7486_006683 [Penicillium sp. IBT 16267x]
MEAVGAASAILGIATAGVQCSVKLVTFAGQIKIAPEQIGFVAEDVSLSASILQQLGELAKENMEYEPRVSDGNSKNATNNNVKSVHDTNMPVSKQSIFNATGLETVMNLAKKCEVIFESLNQSLRKASKQLHEKSGVSGKVKLSRTEMLKWPFLFPGIDTMRNELRNVKGTLMLMLQVAMLAYSRKIMGGYVENKRPTAIVAYSREDQELLVRSIVAAQKSQRGSPKKENPEASNVRSVRAQSLEGEGLRSRLSGSTKRGLASMTCELNGTENTEKVPLSRRSSQSPSETSASPPLRIFDLYIVSPRAFIMNQQIHISYDARIIKLPNLTVESQLQDWKAALKTSVLDQLTALNHNEYEALDATRNHSDRIILQEGTLEWIQFGDYRTLIQGIETFNARTLTIIMSRLPQPAAQFEEATKIEKEKKVAKVETQEERRTTWIKSDSNYLIIKKWISEDFQELLFAHSRRARRSNGFISKIRQIIPFINRRKQEQEDTESTFDNAVEGDMMGEASRQRIRRKFRYSREEVENLNFLNRKTADGEKEWRRKESSDEGQRYTGQEFEKETIKGEDVEILPESDDTEGIVDALLAKYTV